MPDAVLDRTAPLKEEHEAITRQLGLLSRYIQRSNVPSEARLRKLTGDLGSRLRTHFEHEEKTVYEPLAARLEKHGPIDDMIREHASIFSAFELLRHATLDWRVTSGDLGELHSRLESLREEIGKHLEKEEKVLFWLADLKL